MLGLALPLSAREPVVVLTEGTRREVLPVSRDGAEMLSLDNVIAGLGVALRPETPGSSVKLLYEGREVTLFHKKSLASVGGDLRLLSAPALYEDGRWLLPVDAVPRLLASGAGPVIVATSTRAEDEGIAVEAARLGAAVYRGDASSPEAVPGAGRGSP